MTLNAEYTWALKHSRRHAEKCFLEYSLAILRQKEMSPPMEFFNISKVMCVAITGRSPEDIIEDACPNWKKMDQETLATATELYIESNEWPANPFEEEVVFGSLKPDREVAHEAQEWVRIARFFTHMQSAPEDILNALDKLEKSMGWGVLEFDPESVSPPEEKLKAFAHAAPGTINAK